MPNTRENLIELLQGSPTDIMGNHGVGALADHLIANGVTIQRLIPVSERLPEDDDRLTFYDDGRLRCTTVLAYTVYGRTIPKNRLKVRIVNNEYLDTQATDGWVWASGTEEVTHWMPLPLPPKEGE